MEEALDLYRSRLPGCNFDCGVVQGADAGGGAGVADDGAGGGKEGAGGRARGRGRPKRTSGGEGTGQRQSNKPTFDFLGSLKDVGSTAVLWRQDKVVAACTFLAHPSEGFAEITLLAVARGRSRCGLGSALLGAVEAWLGSKGVRCAAACASLDCGEFWSKKGYVPEAALEHRWWALLTDPFGNSRIMAKMLR